MNERAIPTEGEHLVVWAANITAKTQELGLTDVATAAAVSAVLNLPSPLTAAAIGNYRNGERCPRPRMMWAIARVLGVPARDLFPIELDLTEVAA